MISLSGKIKTVFALLLSVAGSAQAQTVFRANAPLTSVMDESVRVEFALNAEPDEESFEAPDFAGFDVLSGPVVAHGESFVVDHGEMTRSINNTITYLLLPQKTGNHTIGAASITVGGRSYKTRPVTIEISDRPVSQSRQDTQAPPQGSLAQDALMLRVNVSRQSVYKGEPLLVSYKLYRRVALAGYDDVKFPSLDGFWAQEIDVSRAEWQRETVNGKVYDAAVIKQSLLYPQQSGTLTIDPASITAVAQVVVQSSHVDPIFGAGQEIRNVQRKLTTPRVSITVKELPAGAPASFTGAVGRFEMEGAFSSNRLAANSAGTYTLKISGTGNLPFISAPKLQLPASFEAYNIKTTESIGSNSNGTTGYRQFEYPFIARVDGDFRIDSVLFTYFNPSRAQYVTLTSPVYQLGITPDEGGGEDHITTRRVSREEVKLLGEDIRFIRLENPRLRPVRPPFLFGGLYWGLFACVVALFAGVYMALRKRIRESRNAVLIRGRRANKVAVQRFRAAKTHMGQQNGHAFYEEMLRALWGYMSDKFNIPVANLTKENVREQLHKRGASAGDLQLFSELITRCDEAQYSPAASARMSDVYREGLSLISRIESIKP